MGIPRSLPPVGDWLGRSFRALRRRGLTLVLLGAAGGLLAGTGALLVYAGAAGAVYAFADRDVLLRLASPDALRALAADPTFEALLLAAHALALFVALRVGCRFAHACVAAAASARDLGFREALRESRERSFAFAALVVLQHLLVQAGTLLLVLPGLALVVLTGFAPFVFVRSGTGVVASLRGSFRLASGRFLGVLGRMLLLGLVCLGVAIVPVLGWAAAPCLALLAWAELHRDLVGVPLARVKTAPRRAA